MSTSVLPEHAVVLREALRHRGLSPTAFAITHKLDGNLLRLLARGESPPRSKAGRLPAPADEKYREIGRFLWGEDSPDTVRWLELLGGLSILLQCLEYWRIADSTDPQGVWAWQVQRADIPASPAWVRRVLNVLYRPGFYRAQLLLRAAAALAFVSL